MEARDLAILTSLARARTREGVLALAASALEGAGVLGGALGTFEGGELRILGHARSGASEAAVRALRESAVERRRVLDGTLDAAPFDDGDARAALVVELASPADALRWRGWAPVLAAHIEAALARSRANEEARRSGRAIEALLIAASHELRGPLATVGMWTHVLVQGDEATRHRASEAIGESLRVHARLIGELVDVARAASGSLPVTMISMSLVSVTRAIVDTLVPVARARGLSLELEAVGDATVWGDPQRLGQAVEGLVEHAVASTPLGGRVVVRVTPGARAVRIAAPAQTEGTSAAHVLGALGVALAREIALLHGGTFGLERAARGGYEHVLQLPRSAGRGAQGALPLLDGARVHVVLSDLAARRALAEVLSACGARVTVADGLADVPPEAALVCDPALVRGRGAVLGVPAVAVLPDESRGAEERARAQGFARVVGRPLDALEVAIAVEALTRGSGSAPPSGRGR